MKTSIVSFKKTLLTIGLTFTIISGCGIDADNPELGLFFHSVPGIFGTGANVQTLLVNDSSTEFTVITPCDYLGLEKNTGEEWVEVYRNVDCPDTVVTEFPSYDNLIVSVPYVFIEETDLPPPGEFRFNIMIVDPLAPADTIRLISQLFTIR